MRYNRMLTFLVASIVIPHALADDPNSYPENRRLWGPTSATFYTIEEGKTIKLTAGPQYEGTVSLQGVKQNQLSCVDAPADPNIGNQQWICTAIRSLTSSEGNSEVFYQNDDGRSNTIVIQVNAKPIVDPTDQYPRVKKATFSYDSKELYIETDKTLSEPMVLVYELYREPGFVLRKIGEQLMRSGNKLTVNGFDKIFEEAGSDGTLYSIQYALCDEYVSYNNTGIVDAHCSKILLMNHSYRYIPVLPDAQVNLAVAPEMDSLSFSVAPGVPFGVAFKARNLGPNGADSVTVGIPYDPRRLTVTQMDTRCYDNQVSSSDAAVVCNAGEIEDGGWKIFEASFQLKNCTQTDTISMRATVNAPWDDPDNSNNSSAYVNIMPSCPQMSSVRSSIGLTASSTSSTRSSRSTKSSMQDEQQNPGTIGQKPFPDLTTSGLAYDAVRHLRDKNIIGGFPDGEFKGARQVNRAEAAKFLLLAAKKQLEEDAGDALFPDMERGAWYGQFIRTCHALGIIKGYPDGTFKPGNTVNTAEFLKMISIAFDLPTGLPYDYKDVSDADWFAPYAGAAQKFNMFPDRKTSLMPGNALNRFEVAIAIYQVLLGLEM